MEHPTKKAKTVVLPSSEEQKQLQQLEILMKNNLLNIQTKELIDQVDASSKIATKKVASFIESLKGDIMSTAKSTCHQRLVTVDWIVNQAKYNLGFHDNEMSIEYQSPKEVVVTGSHSFQTCISPFYNVDILVTMPNSLFTSRYCLCIYFLFIDNKLI